MPTVDLNDFQPLPAPQPAVHAIEPKQRAYIEWSTTPHELRDEDERTLQQWCKKHNTAVVTVMRWMELPQIKMAHRATAEEKGLVDYKVRVMLDAAYAAGLKGNVTAMKMWLEYYGPHAVQTAASVEGLPEPEIEKPKAPAEMTLDELEAAFAKLDGQ